MLGDYFRCYNKNYIHYSSNYTNTKYFSYCTAGLSGLLADKGTETESNINAENSKITVTQLHS